MKKVLVKYLIDGSDQLRERFLIEDENDIALALKNKHILNLHVQGIRKILKTGDKVILNDQGGYCGAKGTWKIF